MTEQIRTAADQKKTLWKIDWQRSEKKRRSDKVT